MDTTLIVLQAFAGAAFAVVCIAAAMIIAACVVMGFRNLTSDAYRWYRRIRKGAAE